MHRDTLWHPSLLRSSLACVTALLAIVGVLGCGSSHERADAGTLGDAGRAGDSGGPGDAGATCPSGQDYYYPGCASEPVPAPIVPGCYQPCTGAGDPTCPASLTCQQTTINPCVCPAGEACCAACGSEVWLCLPPEPTASAVTFRFSFRTDASPEFIFLQTVDASFGEPDWVRVRSLDGDPLQVHQGCACACSSCPACPVCEAPIPETRRLRDGGETVEWTWDGLVHPAGRCAGGGTVFRCVDAIPLAPGRYLADFCWSWTGTGRIGEILDPASITCESVEFAYPPADGIVAHEPCFCG